MCLAVPGRVRKWINQDPMFALAEVEFAGASREVHMACATAARIGDYVIVHAGIAICIVDREQAQRTLADLASLGESRFNDEAAS